MRKIRNKNNPLSGMASLRKDGVLLLAENIRFGWQLRPALTPREWFYLVLEACKEEGEIKERVEKSIKKWIGSQATRYRIIDSLKNKGYL